MIFSCERCGKRYTLADAKVPARGFRCTCTDCGHKFVVGPVAPPPVPPRAPRPPPPPSAPPPQHPPVQHQAPRASPSPEAPEHHQHHERFFASAPGSHHPDAVHGLAPPAAVDRPGRSGRRLALGAAAVAGLLAVGLWGVRSRTEVAAPAGAPEAAVVGSLPPPTTAVDTVMAASAVPRGAVLVEPAQRRAPASPARAAALPASEETIHRAGAPITRRDQKLLDLLHRKEDAQAVAATAVGEPSTGRASLDTGRASLDEAAIRNTLAANSSAFSACITRAGKADAGMRRGSTGAGAGAGGAAQRPRLPGHPGRSGLEPHRRSASA